MTYDTIRPVRRHGAGSVVRGVAASMLQFGAYFVAVALAAFLIAPYTYGWNECAVQVLIRLPFGLLMYRTLRKTKPVERVRKIEKPHFRRLCMFYILLVQVPVQCAFPYLAGTAGDLYEYQATGAILLNTFVLGPVVEELVMRGVFFNLSRKRLGFRPAALTNAAMFSLMHLGRPATMAMTFLMALLYCSLYEMTGHLRYGTVLHLTFNAAAIPVALAAPFVPAAVSFPLLAMSVVLQVMLAVRKDELERRLFQAA